MLVFLDVKKNLQVFIRIFIDQQRMGILVKIQVALLPLLLNCENVIQSSFTVHLIETCFENYQKNTFVYLKIF